MRYEIEGGSLPAVILHLNAGETIISEVGGRTWTKGPVETDTKGGGIGKGLGRMFSGESLFMSHYTAKGPAEIGFASSFAGRIVARELGAGESIICQKSAFLCATQGVDLSVHFQKKLGAGLLGGEGFVLQRLVGDGMAFVHACGKIVEISLRQQSLRVSPGCIVAFEESIGYGIETVDSFSNMFGAKSIFWAKLTGTGHVWLQSLPFNVLANRICEEGKRQGLFGNPREAATPSIRLFE